ncbi:MAG: hypothetical protein COB61_004480 [Thiotrichales bacterium]|nr:hypothetical protein [Thiotrichales bacterium]
MKNIALIAAVIGASSSAFVQADNLGNLHGYATPFQETKVIENKGQLADSGKYGRLSGYGNSINKEYKVSKGKLASTGQYGRLSAYGATTVVVEAGVIAAR